MCENLIKYNNTNVLYAEWGVFLPTKIIKKIESPSFTNPRTDLYGKERINRTGQVAANSPLPKAAAKVHTFFLTRTSTYLNLRQLSDKYRYFTSQV